MNDDLTSDDDKPKGLETWQIVVLCLALSVGVILNFWLKSYNEANDPFKGADITTAE